MRGELHNRIAGLFESTDIIHGAIGHTIDIRQGNALSVIEEAKREFLEMFPMKFEGKTVIPYGYSTHSDKLERWFEKWFGKQS